MSRSLVDLLASDNVESVTGWPMGRVSDVFLNVVISAQAKLVNISSQAIEVENRTEAFILTAEDVAPNWRTLTGDPSIWEPRELLSTWQGSPLKEFWSMPRTITYYFDPEDFRRGLTHQGPLDSAAAIEVTSISGSLASRLVLYATPEYPCSIELATTRQRCDGILSTLKHFVPPSVCSE